MASQESSSCGRAKLRVVDKVARVFDGAAAADEADARYYASLSPQERVDLLLELVNRYRDSLGEAAERLERVCRVTELTEG